MCSDLTEALNVGILTHCLRKVFQTLQEYNLACCVAIQPGLMALALFEGHWFARIIHCKLFLGFCPL